MYRARGAALVGLGIALALAVGLSGAVHGALPRSETLYKAGFQWGPPANFNPFSANAAWPVNSELLLYETLFAYNLVSGELDPILAASLRWDDPLTAVVTLRSGAHWQDGTPLTADDVVYTLALGKRYAVSFSPVWDYLADAEAVDDLTIRLELNPQRPHRALVETYLTQIRIVPAHIWRQIEAEDGTVLEAANLSPVGSGPYRLQDASAQQIVLVRDDEYWGIPYFGTPAPRYVVHPIFKSNDAGNLALAQGQIDLSQQFVPEVWKMSEDEPVGTWYAEEPYYIPASIPSLYINIHRHPLDIPAVRRALALAINYPLIAQIAMSRYSPPARASLIIPLGVPEQRYFSEEAVAAEGWRYDPAAAVQILEEELGATKGRDGIYVLPDGTRLGPFTVECPYGWTDWMTALEVVAQSARAVGIDIRTEYPEQPIWNDHRNTGRFDLLLNTPAGGYTPAHPWLRFRDVMDIRGVPPLGEIAYWNFNRYSNPRVGELLDEAAATTDEERLKAIYQELDSIFRRDIPVIPLMYRPWEFYTFNATNWTGFPTAENPVAPPQHNHAGIHIYYEISPR
ncbi:MAG TPA: ABC transporter substrate-binding protein [Limnochordia bacterium]